MTQLCSKRKKLLTGERGAAYPPRLTECLSEIIIIIIIILCVSNFVRLYYSSGLPYPRPYIILIFVYPPCDPSSCTIPLRYPPSLYTSLSSSLQTPDCQFTCPQIQMLGITGRILALQQAPRGQVPRPAQVLGEALLLSPIATRQG